MFFEFILIETGGKGEMIVASFENAPLRINKMQQEPWKYHKTTFTNNCMN